MTTNITYHAKSIEEYRELTKNRDEAGTWALFIVILGLCVFCGFIVGRLTHKSE